jgi:Ni,Fe-hydrogenase I large subunit
MVPRLYSICGRAQGAAAAAAIEEAEGIEPAFDTVVERERTVVLEAIQEYLWRILIDWPEAMGRSRQSSPVAAARRRIAASAASDVDSHAGLAGALANVAELHIYGEAPDTWLDRSDADALDRWSRSASTLPATLLRELIDVAPTLGASNVALMPAPSRAALSASVLPALRTMAGFERAPEWDGRPTETGALARTHAHPLIAALRARWGNTVPTRMAARLAELALLLRTLDTGCRDDNGAPWVAAFAPNPGEGVAAVETARGLLLHRACVADGRIANYQIVAPTEWNFHPAGPAARGLMGMPARDEATLTTQARLAVQALDPCVAFAIEVAHA